MVECVWLILAASVTYCAMAWLALSLPVHWRQTMASNTHASRRTALWLRSVGGLALGIALVFCLLADHATMAFLVWFMLLAIAATCVALTLTYRAHWLRLLVWR